MGGNVFTDLTVPRLPHDLYNKIRSQCHEVLIDFYEDVFTPAEAPSKRDHGDIDFMVARPKTMHKGKPVTHAEQEIAKALNAVQVKKVSGSKTRHYAVPYPKSSEDEKNEELYAQVDVHVVPNPDFLAWELFLNSWGDLMQIIGVLNRPIGLTVNDRGIYVRIPEIEPTNRKKAMVFLTSSPTDMLCFLRLDVDQYERGFTTNEEVFEWCLNGGLYPAPKQHDETANDRTRIRKRVMFTECMREYYPKHKDRLWPATRRTWTREEVLEEALNTFPQARLGYELAMSEHAREGFSRDVLASMAEVGQSLGAEPKEIAEVVRGSKRFVDYVKGDWVLSGVALHDAVALVPDWMEYITLEQEKVEFLAWLKQNWRGIHERERDRMRVGKGLREAAKTGAGSAVTETTGSVV